MILGTPGLNKVFDVYNLLDEKMKTSSKPIFPILPSVFTAKEEISDFISKGRIIFPDEVSFGNAISRIYHTRAPLNEPTNLPDMDREKVRMIMDNAREGYISPAEIQGLLDACGISRAGEMVV